MDETWLRHYDLETKLHSMFWKIPSSSTPEKFKASHSAGKIIGSLCSDNEEWLTTEDLDRGPTVAGLLCAEQRKKLRNETQKKRPCKLAKIILFHRVSRVTGPPLIRLQK
ncbi:hypothetical protein EVAR_66530_1 [Eumeta japonica]|uniref:Mariner Mos1 transposase n=1 Tax=Eumeta variegata TaxID=151549 RepID=A0A4C1ZDV7_EUMVA|nr:hypothetical protein EVAR_66530_1 [Eumeta japonica]